MKNLTTKVWRAKDVIIKIPGAGYWPVDVPCPAVSYVPPPKNAEKEGDEDCAKRPQPNSRNDESP